LSPTDPVPATALAAVIGSPIGHSRSPSIMRAAFAATGLAWKFAAFEVGPGQGDAAVDALRTLGLRGYSVTMPLKTEVMSAVDRLTPSAEALQAVNCIAWDGDQLVGHNTDGAGFVDSLGRRGIAIDDGPAVVVGAGGAARAIIDALARAGAPEIIVVNRSPGRAESAVSLAGAVGRVGSFDDIPGARLVVNATSVGMAHTAGHDGVAVPIGLLGSHHTVADIVYNPLRTPLLAAAEAAGASTVDGLGMLVCQAARAFTLWTGLAAPIAEMTTAARHTL
jgi:shikimate dehydrogenase